ncbi:MAG: hypothetical protein PHH13_02830 [Candidatus Peribacteraceae bacterium]|nr:hypothetical protein [Candidatus Peribacteraceae bacterium]
MRAFTIITRHPALTGETASGFLKWYFVEVPLHFLRNYREYFRALNEIFSFWFLIKTFLSPWKGIVDRTERKGFDLNLMAQAIALNITSRIIGMVFRLTALVVGMVVEVVFFTVFTAMILVWLAFPMLFFFDLVQFF